MTFTRVQAAGGTATANVAITLPNAIADGDLLVCFFVAKGPVHDPGGISDNINGSWYILPTQAGNPMNGGSSKNLVIGVMPYSKAAAACDLTVTCIGGSNNQWAQIAHYTWSNAADPGYTDNSMAAKVNGGFTTAIAVTSGVPEQTGELQLLAAATDTEAAQTYTPAADATLVLDASNRSGGGLAGAMTIAMEERLSGAAGAWAATMTTSPAQNWSAIVVGFTPAGLADGAFDDASFDANSFWTGPVAPTGQTVVLGLAVEADSSSPITKTKRRSLGQAAETDTAATIAKKKARVLSQAAETDTASTITKRKARLLALALETDSTFPLTVRVPTVVVLGQALETDTPQPATKAKRRTVALAQETDLGLAVTKVKRRTIPLAQETDLGLTATRRKTRTLGQATEANTSSAVTKRKQRTVGQA